jgi:uncharacterized protein YndB with AHSA1/START domain
MRVVVLALLLAAAPAMAQPMPPPGSFDVTIDRKLNAPPAVAYDRLVHVEGWWASAHTYSGDAANLNLEARAGGCWCENWAGGSVEHGRVLAAIPGKLLRISGGFGPLQALPVAAVMTFTLTPADGGKAAALSVHYRVAGPGGELGPPVSAVLGEQIERLVAAAGAPAQ